ncbi:response regulator [Luteimonas sp. R10]|uniref:response regulator n=1 Tax=Luteimonas sp. R10 TaxID=3108176 RepID=UPI003087B6DD|nr:response regulator transcription factor [Luteimonas sp. R10]
MLLDDHDLVRQCIATRLSQEPDIEVTGSFATSRELFAALTQQPAEVVIVDFMLGPSEIDGINLIRALKTRFPECKPLVLSANDTPAVVALSLQAGSRGVFGKVQDIDELAPAIRTVARGRVYLRNAMVEEVAAQSEAPLGETDATAGPLAALSRNAALSPREREVLCCFLDGMSVNEIAAKFSRSANTISTQKHSAYRKLGIRNDSELFKTFHQVREAPPDPSG